MRSIVIGLSAALWIGLSSLADSACAWLEVTAVSPSIILMIASLTAVATSAAATWILSAYIDEDGSSDGDTAPVLRS